MKKKKRKVHVYPQGDTDYFIDLVMLWVAAILFYSQYELVEIHVVHTLPSDWFGGVSLKFTQFDIGVFVHDDGIKVHARRPGRKTVVLQSLIEVVEHVCLANESFYRIES